MDIKKLNIYLLFYPVVGSGKIKPMVLRVNSNPLPDA